MKIIIFIFLLVSTVFGYEQSYIKIAKTSNKNTLLSVNSRFAEIGVPVKYSYTDAKYLIYAGPYNDEESAKEGLEIIKTYFPGAFIVKSEDTQRVIKQKDSQSKNIPRKGDDNFFVGLDLGYSNSISNHIGKEGSVVAKAPYEDFGNYGLDLGYEFKNGIFCTLGYSQIINGDIIMDNIYLSLNYKFLTYYNFSPYFGLFVGNSYLKWNMYPIENPTSFNDQSTSVLTGAQFGVSYPINNEISLSLAYRVAAMDHVSTLKTQIQGNSVINSSELHHKRLDNILFGIQYKF
ncbi:MAG: hypothetical protein NTW78_00820 [Campylobacterales bacterium]|nr:hypothetical protein [Campylobacterales bacterium]